MGSTKHSSDKKKYKEKEKLSRNRRSVSKEPRERSRSRERRRDRSRERGRDRSRSKERGRDRSRERGHDKSREKKRNRSTSKERKKSSRKEGDRSHERDVGRLEKSPEHGASDKKKARKYEDKESESRKRGRKKSSTPLDVEEDRRYSPVEVKTTTSGDTVALSIEETNKLRISLGLKPLQVEGSAKEENEELTIEAKSRKEPIPFPVKNIGKEKEAEKLRSKISTIQETRKLLKTLNSVKTLGEADEEEVVDGDEDTLSWVAKMRNKDEAKKKAEKKARLLEEMDEEFGVSDLLSEVMGTDKHRMSSSQEEYGSQDLQGIKVEHDTSAFRDGSDITLVIKDSNVLDESEPVLLNVNLLETEKASKNVELRKGRPEYNPYENEEVDEIGNVKQITLLNKYDEEIYGEKKTAFVLGEGGLMDTTIEKEREIVRQRLIEKSVTLATGPSQIASEYYSTEEMVAFKKPKKRKKLRKKEKVKADDLMPLDAGDEKRDHGSRIRHLHGDMEDSDIPAFTTDIDLKDEADSSVTTALMRTRRLLQKPKESTESTGAAKVATMLQQVKKEETFVSKTEPTIILDKTTEFCKQVGGEEQEDPKDIARRKSSTDHLEDHLDEEEDMEAEEEEEEEEEEDDEGGWKEVKEHTKKKEKPKVDDLYQEAEPLVASGVTATIQLASKKGFVDLVIQSKKPENVEVVTSVGRRDVEYERQKERERDRELSRYGRDSTFPEKKNYSPNVLIEYVDDTGRLMNTKEAFRFMSHKFHGRTSGRKKMDKRLKKIQEEKLLKSASSTDTPLNTLSVLKSKQKAAQSPYILISGGAQSLLAPDIAKRK